MYNQKVVDYFMNPRNAGRIEDADAMLGAPYACGGVVVPGNRLGRTIGFPTLNLAWSPELRPRYGVYVVRLRVPASGKVFRGIANEWLRFVRPETRFDGIGALKAQLEKDKLAALDFSEETYPAGV